MHSTPKLAMVAVVAFAFGAIMLFCWISRVLVVGSPIVTGTVIARTPTTEWGIPRVDFTVEISDTAEVVHAHTQRYLLDEVPAQVRFHYTGDTSRPVYLFEHEENPLWIWLLMWAIAIFLGLIVCYRLYKKSMLQVADPFGRR